MRRLTLLAALALAGCDDGGATEDPDNVDAAPPDGPDATDDVGPPDVPPDPWCPGPAAQRYDPLVSPELELFPDDLLTQVAPDSPTGLLLDVSPESAPWVGQAPGVLRDALDDLNHLSGFGTSAGILLRFTEPVTVPDDSLLLYDLGLEPPQLIPVAPTLHDEGRGLVVQPLRPLRMGTRHALFAVGLQDGEGAGCVRPSETLQTLLTGTAEGERFLALQARYADALTATGTDPHTVSAATVFTTHRDLEVLTEVAAEIRGRDYTWSEPPQCEDGELWRLCEGSFEAFDYRDGRHVATPAPTGGPWTIPVSVWLPKEGEGPFPTLVYGHGINDKRQSGEAFADRFAPRGYAVVASDAMRHGEHPTADPEDGLAALAFLGIDIQAVRIDALTLRGNFNQTTLDRLQLLQLIRQAPDVDGDEAPDLDGGRIAYWGVSLGGMLGPSLLALSEDVGAGILSVAGGQLLLFVTDTGQIAPLRPAIITLFGSEARFERLLPVAQALVDAADPASFGPFVLGERLDGGDHSPNVLFPVAVEDQTVPPASGKALARALAVTHVEPVVEPVELLPSAPAPLSENTSRGVTAGFFQYDRVSTREGDTTPATHGNTPLSQEAELQARHFLETWLGEGPAEILDPYDVLETPPLR